MKTRTQRIVILTFAFLLICTGGLLHSANAQETTPAKAEGEVAPTLIPDPDSAPAKDVPADADKMDSEKDKEEKEKAIAIPQFKKGDKVYLAISGNVPRMVVYLSAVDKHKDKNPAKDDDFKGEFLIPYDESIDVHIGGSSKDGIMYMNAKKLLDNLAEQIKKNPTDKTQWQTKMILAESEVNFKFAGIQRFYELQTIIIPAGKHRRGQSYAPRLRLRIDKNGEYVSYIQTSNEAWISDFPSHKKNRIKVRVWGDERFVFRLRDWNTNISERHIIDIAGITSADFEKGKIVETVGDFENESEAITFEFREVK